MDDARRCTARSKRSGQRCKRAAARGATVCSMHGAKSPAAARKARERVEREAAERAARTYGAPVDVDPHDALLQEVHRTAGHVAWLGGIVADLERDALVRGITKTVTLPDGGRRVEAEAAVNIWVKVYQDERDHLRRVCADAIRAGVEERRVEIEEEKAAKLAEVVRAIVTDLGHDLTDDRVRKVVRLRLIEGGKAA